MELGNAGAQPASPSRAHQFEMIRSAAGDAIRSVVLQAERIQHAELVPAAFDDKSFQLLADARFLIVALRWVHRHCAAASRLVDDPALVEAVAAFEANVFHGEAKGMRDVWEHLDDYIVGSGHLQRERVRRQGVADRRHLGVLTWIGADDSLGTLTWAGFAMSLDGMVIAARRLYAALVATSFATLPTTPDSPARSTHLPAA